MTFIPVLGRKDALRLQIRTVLVAADHQNRGVGSALMKHAMELGKQRGATLVQLTTDKHRTDAHHFYERLGFEASHQGFKRSLQN